MEDQKRNQNKEVNQPGKSNLDTTVIIITVILVTFFTCFAIGLVIVQIPTIAADIDMPEIFLLW